MRKIQRGKNKHATKVGEKEQAPLIVERTNSPKIKGVCHMAHENDLAPLPSLRCHLGY